MATDNKYTGEVPIEINGKPYTLLFDWAAIAKLRGAYGVNVVRKMYEELDPTLIGEVLLIGLEHKHAGEFTIKQLMKITPPIPIMPLINDLDKALSFANFGPQLTEELEKVIKKNQKGDETPKVEKPTKKKTK